MKIVSGKLTVRNSITAKIYGNFIILLAIFVVFIVFNKSVSEKYLNANEKSTSVYYTLIKMKSDIMNAEESIREFLVSGNRTSLDSHNESIRSFAVMLGSLNSRQQSAETMSFLRSIEDSFYSYQRVCNNAARYYSQQDNYQSLLNKIEGARINTYISKYCDELLMLRVIGNRTLLDQLIEMRGFLTAANVFVFFALLALFIVSIGYLKRMLNEELKNVKIQHRLERMRFLALQSQINPHFLFNTLGSISRTVSFGRDDAAILMIDSLSKLLRYSLSDNEKPVPLGDELAIAGEYLKIQQYRFQERIQSSIEFEQEMAERVLVPRLTLQPIVENAVIHGLEPKPEGGNIAIRAFRKGDFCYVTITDNGVGMDEDKVQRVMEEEAAGGRGVSLGVCNTLKRLRLFTRSDRVMEINSREGEGTEVVIILNLLYTNSERESDVHAATG